MNVFPLCPQTNSAAHQNQHTIHGLSYSSTPLQYLQPGHSYPAAPYTGQQCAATPAPASLCSVNIQHTVGSANYTPPSVQQNHTTGSISASAVSQNVAQSYQSPGHQQKTTAAAPSASSFLLKEQQTCQNCATPPQQQTPSASGYPPQVQQQSAAAPTLQAHSYLFGSGGPAIAATAQSHLAQAPSTLQQVQGTVNLSSQQPGQNSATPAFYNQQIPVQQENQPLLLQNTQSNIQLTKYAGQAYIQSQLQHCQETQHNILREMALSAHHSESVQCVQSHEESESRIHQTQTPASQTLPTENSIVQVAGSHQSFSAAGLPDTGSQSYGHYAFNMLQQPTLPAQSQYLCAQSTTAQTNGATNQVGTLRCSQHFLPSIVKTLFMIMIKCIAKRWDTLCLFFSFVFVFVLTLFLNLHQLQPYLCFPKSCGEIYLS